MMKTRSHILALVMAFATLCTWVAASVDISADFTTSADARELLYEMWGVANRISPTNGVAVRPGMKVNTVRMIGGIVKKDENGARVPDLDFDLCFFNEETESYVYDFAPLIARIDAIIDGNTEIHQIVLDQPPWAFQHGYTFIPEGQQDGVHFRENERISVYGNSLPPADKSAYFDFIAALMQRLLAEYGEATVKTWRFRIGSEIETPDHWHGTEQDFIEHFANSVAAIRSVLPGATVGLHTRPPNFVYKSGTVRNYKGEVIKSFADGLIEYCHDNDVRYDFWGVSDYPFITQEKTRDPKEKYELMFGDLVNHPKWRAGTVIDVEEFSVITKISGELISSDSAQADTFYIAMSDLFYEKGVDQVFQWGQRVSSHEAWRTRALTEMVGKVRYQAEVSSEIPSEGENIGALIGRSPSDEAIDVILYNYDPADIEAEDTKDIRVRFATDIPAGTTFYFRKTLAGRDQHAFNTFMEDDPPSGWLKSGYSKYGSPSQVLNEAGLAAWATYENPNPRTWTSWSSAETIAQTDGKSGSIIQIESQLPLFAFEKIEVRWTRESPGTVLVGWDQWTSTPSVATVANGITGTTTKTRGSWAPQFRGGSKDGTFGSLPVEAAAADLTVGSSSAFHYTGYRSSGMGERSIDFFITEDAGTGFDLGEFRFDLISRGGSGAESWTLEVLDGGSLSPGPLATGTIERSFDANYLSNVDVDLVGLADSRLDAGESATFRLTISTADNRSIDLDNVGISQSGTIESSLDTDGNGLPDAWERHFFGTIGQDPNLDGDGDSYAHMKEYIMGTNPKERNSALQLLFEPSEDSTAVSWNSVEGRSYTVYSTTDLPSNNWIPVTENLSGTGETLIYQRTGGNQVPIFYKVTVSYP